MAKGLLGSRFNEPPKRKRMGVYSSTSMESAPRRERPENIERTFGLFMARPSKGCVKNAYSREEAGTVGNIIVTKRFSNSRLTCVCKSRNWS